MTRHDEATVGGTNDRGNCGFVSLLSVAESLEALSHGHATDTTHARPGSPIAHPPVHECHQEVLASRGPQSSPGLPTSLADLHPQLHLYISAAFAFHLTLFSLFSLQALTSSPHYFYYLLIDLGRPFITQAKPHTHSSLSTRPFRPPITLFNNQTNQQQQPSTCVTLSSPPPSLALLPPCPLLPPPTAPRPPLLLPTVARASRSTAPRSLPR